MRKTGELDCILLVDDDEATNFLHRRVISREALDVHVQVVHDGQEALDYLTGSDKYYLEEPDFPQPGIIFLDLNMPGMNGWEFLDSYKRLPVEKKKSIALLVLTTSLNPDDENRAKNYPDLDGFLRKPLTPEKLHRVIGEYFG